MPYYYSMEFIFCSFTTSSNSSANVNVVVVVGGVHVLREEVLPRYNSSSSKTHHMLHMNITFHSPSASCRKFAERVQQLVQFPDMCEEDCEKHNSITTGVLSCSNSNRIL